MIYDIKIRQVVEMTVSVNVDDIDRENPNHEGEALDRARDIFMDSDPRLWRPVEELDAQIIRKS